MNITTKFKVFDNVWFMHENKPREIMINSVVINVTGHQYRKINVDTSDIAICYRFNDDKIGIHHESLLFATKAELLASL